jgi:hypothetical protein
MQSAKCTISSTWAWDGGPSELDALDELGEFEPQAAITVAATIAATAIGRLEETLGMTQVYPVDRYTSATRRHLGVSAERGLAV